MKRIKLCTNYNLHDLCHKIVTVSTTWRDLKANRCSCVSRESWKKKSVNTNEEKMSYYGTEH